jgi:hypothetical protein
MPAIRIIMRREWRWALAAVAALTVGATCAEPYARVAAPYYGLVADLLAQWHPWRIDEVVVADDPNGRAVLRMTGEVFQRRGDPSPAARMVVRIQVGEAIEVPIVFWTVLLMWPATTIRHRLLHVAVGVPVFLGLEGITTGCQLVYAMPKAVALSLGDHDLVTSWDRWSRFLGDSGRLALALAAALLAISVAKRLQSRSRANRVAAA